MIKYELAKQLKDAGFKQYGRGGMLTKLNEDFTRQESVYEPTLSELIEACGEDFGNLEYDNNIWNCWAKNPKYHGYGSTPEEAVAKLYISLHKDNMSDQEAINLDRDMWGGRGKG
jgi:hypothetical protein